MTDSHLFTLRNQKSISLTWDGETVFLTVAGNHLFGSDVQETSDNIETSCIVLYNTAPT